MPGDKDGKWWALTDSHPSVCWSVNRGAAVPSEGWLMDNSQSLGNELGWLPSRDFLPHGVKAVQSSLQESLCRYEKGKKGASIAFSVHWTANVTRLIIVSYETKSCFPLGRERRLRKSNGLLSHIQISGPFLTRWRHLWVKWVLFWWLHDI